MYFWKERRRFTLCRYFNCITCIYCSNVTFFYSVLSVFLMYTIFSAYVANIIWTYPRRSRLIRTSWWQTFRASARRCWCTWCWTCWASEWVYWNSRWEVLTAYLHKLFVTKCKIDSMFILVNFVKNLLALFFMNGGRVALKLFSPIQLCTKEW